MDTTSTWQELYLSGTQEKLLILTFRQTAKYIIGTPLPTKLPGKSLTVTPSVKNDNRVPRSVSSPSINSSYIASKSSVPPPIPKARPSPSSPLYSSNNLNTSNVRGRSNSSQWTECKSEDGRTYFWNSITNETSWSLPTDIITSPCPSNPTVPQNLRPPPQFPIPAPKVNSSSEDVNTPTSSIFPLRPKLPAASSKPTIVPINIKPLSLSDDVNNSSNLIPPKPNRPANTSPPPPILKPIIKSSLPPAPAPISKPPPIPPKPQIIQQLEEVEEEVIVEEEPQITQSNKPFISNNSVSKLGSIIQTQGKPLAPISTVAAKSIVPIADLNRASPPPVPSRSNAPLPPRKISEDISSNGGRGDATSNGIRDPKQFKPNKKLLTEGSHMSISLPSNITHTNNFKVEDFVWTNDSFEKLGFLWMNKGLSGWKQYWFSIKHGFLNAYEEKTDTIPLFQLNLKGSNVEIDTKSSKPFAFRLTGHNDFKAKTEQITLAGYTQEDLNEWLPAIRISGSIDSEFANKDRERRQKEEEKQRNEERKRREEQMKQAEEDYIKNKQNYSPDLFKAKQEEVQSSIDIYNCACLLKVLECKENDQLKLIHVVFDIQEWFIYRFDKQISDLYLSLTRTQMSNSIRGLSPKWPKTYYETQNSMLCFNVDTLLGNLIANRNTLATDKKAWVYFTRFIAPVQLGDEKPDRFVLPFKIELL